MKTLKLVVLSSIVMASAVCASDSDRITKGSLQNKELYPTDSQQQQTIAEKLVIGTNGEKTLVIINGSSYLPSDRAAAIALINEIGQLETLIKNLPEGVSVETIPNQPNLAKDNVEAKTMVEEKFSQAQKKLEGLKAKLDSYTVK